MYYTDDEVVSPIAIPDRNPPIGIGANHDFVPARHAKAGGSAYLCRITIGILVRRVDAQTSPFRVYQTAFYPNPRAVVRIGIG